MVPYRADERERRIKRNFASGKRQLHKADDKRCEIGDVIFFLRKSSYESVRNYEVMRPNKCKAKITRKGA